MSHVPPRIAVRAVIVHEARLLLVNAWPDGRSSLMCAPGGGVNKGTSLPENLIREVHEETGLEVDVGPVCLVNEFHDPDNRFHQVEIFFRCTLPGSARIDPAWRDPENIVQSYVWVSRDELGSVWYKPDGLGRVAFNTDAVITYDPLETIVS